MKATTDAWVVLKDEADEDEGEVMQALFEEEEAEEETDVDSDGEAADKIY